MDDIRDRIDKYLNEKLGEAPRKDGVIYIGAKNNNSLFKNIPAKKLKEEGIEEEKLRITVDVDKKDIYVSNFSLNLHNNLIASKKITLSNKIVKISGWLKSNYVLVIQVMNPFLYQKEVFDILKNFGYKPIERNPKGEL
jgi:hypothetical protein